MVSVMFSEEFTFMSSYVCLSVVCNVRAPNSSD